MIRNLITIMLCAVWVSCHARKADGWQKLWRVESESEAYRVTALGGDTLEIISPKGLTLWRRQMMRGDMTAEYDACVMDEGRAEDRLSDMNLFWMASDPAAKDIWAGMSERRGVFKNCAALQLYYLGYGGNYNSTTRFRRYNGKPAPPIIKEYTDSGHLLRPNHWYHIRVQSLRGTVSIYVDGELVVAYRDPEPLTRGWFGFRTTLSRTRIANFRCRASTAVDAPLHWVGERPAMSAVPVSFGVPFAEGELRRASDFRTDGMAVDTWVNAWWPDGSVKWLGVAGVTGSRATMGQLEADGNRIVMDNGRIRMWIPRSGANIIDSITIGGRKVCGAVRLTGASSRGDMMSAVDSAVVERAGRVRSLVKVCGRMSDDVGKWLPFMLRLYVYAATGQVRLVHSFIYDGDQDRDFIASLGVQAEVPLRGECYNRHVAFSTGDGIWTEPVQPLDGRCRLDPVRNRQAQQMSGLRIPERDSFDARQRKLLDEWARWDGFRLSQTDDGSFTIRKRARKDRPWIGTMTGGRSDGLSYVGDMDSGMAMALKDFWQQYPSTLQIDGAATDMALLTVWLWSPEAERMDLRHYDTVPHGLLSSYEDVQEGMSTPYGIARTSEITLLPFAGHPGKETLATWAATLAEDARLLPTPDYLHGKRAFGVWSLASEWRPTETGGGTALVSDSLYAEVERRLDNWIDIYRKAIDDNHWYGFWNYGDVMHAYDDERHTWRYDVGGFAWDNTELASPDWLWYSFLRTGRKDIWRMAEAMTRHNSEVDTYHIGPMAALGSRHNVSHWGCGAKEARISQAAFNRFYYYLTTDDRMGDLMTAVRDADRKLYDIDPMRLAEPRGLFPCGAPARLRIGPDWLAYVGNWMTEWERTGNTVYRDKILAGMRSIGALPDGLFTGNKALGFDPETGIISYDGKPGLQNTNHLMTIMGGFEIVCELQMMLDEPSFGKAWLRHAAEYKRKAREISRNRFPVRRLEAYAAAHLNDREMAAQAWRDLLRSGNEVSTNAAALWSLDAIYMLEVLVRL